MKKEDTPKRIARRQYEERNKEKRNLATRQFNTRLPTKNYEEICAFLKEKGIRKIDLIYIGYETLKKGFEDKTKLNKDKKA